MRIRRRRMKGCDDASQEAMRASELEAFDAAFSPFGLHISMRSFAPSLRKTRKFPSNGKGDPKRAGCLVENKKKEASSALALS